MKGMFGENEIGKARLIKYEYKKGPDPKSFVSISGLTDSLGESTNAYIVDFSALNNERIALMPCFGKRTYIFTYGHDLSTSRSSVTLIIFLGTKDCAPGDNTNALKKFTDYYKNNRISKSGTKISVSMGGDTGFASGHLISMQVKAYSPELNAVTVTVMYLTEAPE